MMMRPVPVPVHWLFTPGQPGPDRRQSESRQVLLFHVDLSPVTGRSQCVKAFLGGGGVAPGPKLRGSWIWRRRTRRDRGWIDVEVEEGRGKGWFQSLRLLPPPHHLFLGAGAELEGETRRYHAIHSSDAGLTWRLHRCDGGEVVIYPSFPNYAFQESLPRDIPLPLHCKYQIDSTPPSNTTEHKKQRETAPTSEQPDTSLLRFSWLRSQRTSRS